MSIERIADSFSLDLIVMFGSRARGKSITTSDTDIAVRSQRELSRGEELHLATLLDKFFPSVTQCASFKRKSCELGQEGAVARFLEK
jgi:predicted nucleotidyltransferase